MTKHTQEKNLFEGTWSHYPYFCNSSIPPKNVWHTMQLLNLAGLPTMQQGMITKCGAASLDWPPNWVQAESRLRCPRLRV